MSETCCEGFPRKKLCCRECEQSHISKLESQLSQVQGELDRFKTGNSYLLGIQDGERHVDFNLQAERDSLQVEVRRFEGEWLEAKKEVQRLRDALGFIHKYVDRNSMINVECFEKAKQALSSNEGE